MTALEACAKAGRQYNQGIITAQEYVSKLTTLFASDQDFDLKDAAIVLGLILAELMTLVKRQVENALTPSYKWQSPALGYYGQTETKQEKEADTRRETKRERAWAAVLKPLLPD